MEVTTRVSKRSKGSDVDQVFDKFDLRDRARASDLSHRNYRVLDALLSFADDDGGSCFPSRKKLSDRSGCSLSGVDRALKELQDLGWISRERPHDGGPVHFIFPP